ncbi:hypothetical protein FACS1894111_08120 [Clostridia bacterium]|nr:hypothetical protein FACS1894111_08120 [Clostridia bacterium]
MPFDVPTKSNASRLAISTYTPKAGNYDVFISPKLGKTKPFLGSQVSNKKVASFF